MKASVRRILKDCGGKRFEPHEFFWKAVRRDSRLTVGEALAFIEHDDTDFELIAGAYMQERIAAECDPESSVKVRLEKLRDDWQDALLAYRRTKRWVAQSLRSLLGERHFTLPHGGAASDSGCLERKLADAGDIDILFT